mgnify:CR=1 FL=1|jgi:hypothetical protein
MKLTANIIRDTVSSGNARACVRIAETLRFEYSMDYGKSWRMVNNLTGISMADWDALLLEGETHEA